MKNEYTATVKLSNGSVVDKTFSTIAEALAFCKKCVRNCGADFAGCNIIDGWADELYNCTIGGVESYFVKHRLYIDKVDEKTL